MPDAAYRLSFTTGGLLREESTAIAQVLLQSPDALAARERAIADNVVQQRTTSSTVRVTREVLQRLSMLPPPGLELVARGSVDDARHILWLAACLRYRFLRDFGREVVRERYGMGRTILTYEDFDAFWNVQSSWVDALRDTADSTRNKLRQNTFRMLREAEFIGSDLTLRPASLSAAVIKTIDGSFPSLFLSFPLDDAHVAALAASAENSGR